MFHARDPAIKLFGKTIPVPDIASSGASRDGSPVAPPPDPSSSCSGSGCAGDCADENPASSSPEADESDRAREEPRVDKESLGENTVEVQRLASEEITDRDASSTVNETPAAKAHQPSKTEDEQSETSISQEKPLKKPDRVLPCPRCNSMETKFCYYNNYNVNQPRHFCKNCQRYWTAGGSMRNVPVGAGRRKSKNLAPHCRHVAVSEALQGARTDAPLGPNGATVLAFGPESPLCESVASATNLSEKTTSHGCLWNDQMNESVVTDSNPKDEAEKSSSQETMLPSFHGFNPQIPCLPGAPWPYPWNWSPPMALPPFFSMTFYPPPAYWGCSVPVPWLAQPLPDQSASVSGAGSPNLGKHSRDKDEGEEGPQVEGNCEKQFWVPKTLRIDDLGEAAKSSIWATLGILNDKVDSSPSGKGLLKAFPPKGDENDHLAENSPFLLANPAAMSRSQNFHERS